MYLREELVATGVASADDFGRKRQRRAHRPGSWSAPPVDGLRGSSRVRPERHAHVGVAQAGQFVAIGIGGWTQIRAQRAIVEARIAAGWRLNIGGDPLAQIVDRRSNEWLVIDGVRRIGATPSGSVL